MPVLHYTVSGNAGAAGVLVSATGAATGSATSASDGTYTIGGLIAGVYAITPSLAGATFTPASLPETIVASNITDVNFVAKATVSFRTTATDNFTRPDAVTLGPNWAATTDLNISCAIVSDLAVGPAGSPFNGINIYTGTSFANNQFVSVTVSAIAASGSITVQVRGNLADTSGYFFILDGSSGAGNLILESAAGNIGLGVPATVSAVPGDIMSIQVVGSLITAFYNGVPTISATDTTYTSGSPIIEVQGDVAQSDTSISLFTAGDDSAPLPYSVPDCRNYATFPNSSRDVNDTLIYDVQTSSNPDVPGTDSRTAGAPVDSRATPNIPLNSRTPGIYGPGE